MNKYIPLVVGIVATLLSGVPYSFNTFAIALKSTFNYTQVEIESIASSGDIGLHFGLPAGVVYDRFGPRASCVLSLILGTVGFTSLWLATKFRTFFALKSWLVCAFYLVSASGAGFLSITSLGVNLKNFGRKSSGKITGLLASFFGIAPAIISAIYQGLFVQGHIKDAENQKYGEFMLFLAGMSVIINLLAIAFLRENSDHDEIHTDEEMNELFKTLDKDKVIDGDIDSNDETPLNPNADPEDSSTIQQNINGLQMIKTLEFYYLYVIVIILGGTGATYINNITLVLKSAHRENIVALFTISLPIFGFIGRLASGWIINCISLRWPYIPKSLGLLPSAILMCVSLIVILSFYHEFTGLFISALIMNLAFGLNAVQVRWIIAELFGIKYYGQNFGIITSAHMLGMCGFHQLFGFNYELNSQTGSKDCYGESCSKGSFVLFAILCSCAICLIICLFKIERDKVNKRIETIE